MRSVVNKLYELNDSIIETMAKNNVVYPTWTNVAFSYDKNKVKNDAVKVSGTEIYINVVYTSNDIVTFIRELLKAYDLDIRTDFKYGARG